jgi:hypothetical protein
LEALFKWMSELGTAEGLKYFCILAVLLALMPYFDLIKLFFRQLVLRKELQIHFFEFSTEQNVYAGTDDQGNQVFIDLPGDDVFIIGQKIKLYWKVDGAYRVDIVPIGKGLKGNCAHVLVTEGINKYELTAHGFWGKKESLEISIPENRVYHLDTTQLSNYSDHIIRPVPPVNTLNVTENYPKVRTLSKSKLKGLGNWSRLIMPGLETNTINTERLIHANHNKRMLYKYLDDARMLKGYSFSTKKYQDPTIINHN